MQRPVDLEVKHRSGSGEAHTDPGTARRILLVDDDHDFADSLAALLKFEGYDVDVAYSADASLETVARRPPQVALVDIRLGHSNGVELVRALRRLSPNLIAVMITAYATIEATIGALQAGAYDYLCKPFHTDDLLATIERCFERQRLEAERARAVAALQARNCDLEALNARLTRVLASVRDLSRADTVARAGRTLLAIVINELTAAGGVFYLREGDVLERQDDASSGYEPALELPPPPGTLLAEALDLRRPAIREASEWRLGLTPPGVGAVLAVPLIDDDDVVGMIAVHAHAGGRFTKQDVEVAQILASFGAAIMRAARVSERLARSEERLRYVVDNSPSAISLTDLQGLPLLNNVRFLEWFPDGVSGAVSTAGPGSTLPADAPDALSDQAVIALGRAITREIDVASGTGTPRHLLVTRFPVFDSGGQPIGVGTIVTDVTERFLAEERLRHAQRMEAMGQLTGGVAHDFNNLLAVVLGNLRLIEEGSRERPELIELIEDALDATRSGVELTKRLLAFGRAQPLHPEVTDIRELVLTTSRLLGRTLGEGITIQLTLAPDCSSVLIDRSQLEASLLNLAINARDAIAGSGKLGLAVRNVALDPAADLDPDAMPGRYVALSVTDDGVGMTADARQRAIQPFFTTKPVGQGSGLGLSMVYGFVRQSGGFLKIESELGHGATVTLYFPAIPSSDRKTAARETSATAAPPGRGERVLLVEDQPQVRLLLKRQLTRLGYSVVDVKDARSALVQLTETPGIDVLLTDVVLPGEMNGLQLCETARARIPTLGVILTTGHAAEMLADRSGPLAAASILPKPVDPDVLARSLRAVLERSAPGRPRGPRRADAQWPGGENT